MAQIGCFTLPLFKDPRVTSALPLSTGSSTLYVRLFQADKIGVQNSM